MRLIQSRDTRDSVKRQSNGQIHQLLKHAMRIHRIFRGGPTRPQTRACGYLGKHRPLAGTSWTNQILRMPPSTLSDRLSSPQGHPSSSIFTNNPPPTCILATCLGYSFCRDIVLYSWLCPSRLFGHFIYRSVFEAQVRVAEIFQ